MTNSIAALLADAEALRTVANAFPADRATWPTLYLGSRSARVLDDLCEAYGARPLRTAVREFGRLSDLARLVGNDDTKRDDAFHAELRALGVDAERAEIFEQQLSGEKVLLVVRYDHTDETVLPALLAAGADFGLENGSGVTLTLPLRREVLEVVTTVVPDYEVVVRTEVIVETKRLEIQLEREEIVIERRDLSVPDAPLTVTRIPIKHEEAVLQKRVIVTGEVVVRTEQYVEKSVVNEELRHEIFNIENNRGSGV